VVERHIEVAAAGFDFFGASESNVRSFAGFDFVLALLGRRSTGFARAYGENLSVAGTVAMAVLPEDTLTVRPLCAAADRQSVRFCVALALMVALDGEKLSVAGTLTTPVPDVQPLADAVMVAEPMLTPVTCGML